MKLLRSYDGSIPLKLERLRQGIYQRAQKIRKNRVGIKETLENKLKDLIRAECDDETLLETINIRVQLNLEIEKEERY